MKCKRKACSLDAVCGIQINVPARHGPMAIPSCIQILISLPLCQKHLDEATPKYFFEAIPDLKPGIRRIVANRAEPDFERAFISRLELELLAKLAKP